MSFDPDQEPLEKAATLFGLPEGTAGMLLPGGTFATLQGLLLARTRHFPSWLTEGPGSLPGPPLPAGFRPRGARRV